MATGLTDRVATEHVPDALAPPPGHPRFPLFDGLRAIAALAVVVTHTGSQTGFALDNAVGGAITARMNVGVAIFFVISGFLLYRPFVAARLEGRPRPGVRRYFRRRLLRIVPAYWFALTVCAIVFSDVVHDVFTDDWWIYYFFLQNLSYSHFFGGLIVAWSLCIEVAFYLALPLYAMFSARLFGGRGRISSVQRELLVLAAIGIASLTARTLSYAVEPTSAFERSLPGMLLWFCFGMGLAVISAGGLRFAAVRLVERRPGLSWLAAGATLALACSLGWPRVFEARHGTDEWLLEHLLFGLIGFFLVAPAVFGRHDSVPGRILGNRVVQWLGLVSYGIFLWHVPISAKVLPISDDIPVAGYPLFTVLVAVLATAAAAVSYYVVERPLLRFKERGPAR